MVEAVLFDIDGTLVDSVDLHAQAWQDAFGWYGKSVPFLDLRSKIGMGGDLVLEQFLTADENRSFGKELAERRTKHYLDVYMPRVRPFPKETDLLRAISAKGIKIAYATSAQEEELKHLRQLLDAESEVDAETTKDDVARSKPYPDIFNEAMKRVRVCPSQCVVVGDSPYDAEASTKLGIRPIGLLCGGFPAESLMSAGCLSLSRDPADLL